MVDARQLVIPLLTNQLLLVKHFANILVLLSNISIGMDHVKQTAMHPLQEQSSMMPPSVSMIAQLQVNGSMIMVTVIPLAQVPSLMKISRAVTSVPNHVLLANSCIGTALVTKIATADMVNLPIKT